MKKLLIIFVRMVISGYFVGFLSTDWDVTAANSWVFAQNVQKYDFKSLL